MIRYLLLFLEPLVKRLISEIDNTFGVEIRDMSLSILTPSFTFYTNGIVPILRIFTAVTRSC